MPPDLELAMSVKRLATHSVEMAHLIGGNVTRIAEAARLIQDLSRAVVELDRRITELEGEPR
jgi:hypothetical protein